jgi:hypothetical protein
VDADANVTGPITAITMAAAVVTARDGIIFTLSCQL